MQYYPIMFAFLSFFFQINFGCCTVDILKQLSGQEISRKPPGGKPGDRIGRLASHILKQQRWFHLALSRCTTGDRSCAVVKFWCSARSSYSYYPLYPPAPGVPLDLSLAKEALEIPSAPDVLLLPSDLAPFVKVNNKFAAQYRAAHLL